MVLKVDIKDWHSPVCAQYGIDSVPYAVLFDPSGRKLGDGDKAFEEFGKLLERRR